MRRKQNLLGRLGIVFTVYCMSLMLMGGCINPFVGPSIGEAKVEGRVLYFEKEFNALRPLPGAMVTVDGSMENTYTDANGYYSMTIRYRVGNLAKSAEVKLTVYHDYAAGSATQTVVVKDTFTTTVPAIKVTL